VVLASTNLDQSAQGDQWHDIGTVRLLATNLAYVRLTASSGTCVADALHVRSASRYNNGQPASSVHLQPMDGIILQRDQPVLARPGFAGARVMANALVLTATNLTPGVGYASNEPRTSGRSPGSRSRPFNCSASRPTSPTACFTHRGQPFYRLRAQ